MSTAGALYADYLTKNQLHVIAVPIENRHSEAYAFKKAVNAWKQPVMAPQDQQKGIEKHFFLQAFTAESSSVKTNAFAGTLEGDSNTTPCAIFKLQDAKHVHITEFSLSFEVTTPTDAGSAGASLMPAFFWIDRVESSWNSVGQPFQILYGSMMIRLLIASLPPEKLYVYAAMSGGWINPTNVADSNLTVPAVASTPQAAQTVFVGRPNNAGQRLMPVQLKTKAAVTTGAKDLTSRYMEIDIPLIGHWVQQAGLFSLDWINKDSLYMRVYGNPARFCNYTDQATAAVDPVVVNGDSRFLLWARCFLEQDADKEARSIGDLPDHSNLQIAYCDFRRARITPSVTPIASSSQFDIKLDTYPGRRCGFLVATAMGTPVPALNHGGSYHLLQGTPAQSYPLASDSVTLAAGTQWRTHLGDMATTRPSYDLTNTAKTQIRVYGSNFLTHNQNVHKLITPRLINNPWTLGLCSDQDSYAPLYGRDIPIVIGNPLSMIQGRYDGGFELANDTTITVYTGANADTSVTQYEVIYALWGTLRINSAAGGLTVVPDADQIKLDLGLVSQSNMGPVRPRGIPWYMR